MTKEALKLALEALESCYSTGDDYKYQFYDDDLIIPAITAIKKALAQPEQEPVAWVDLELWTNDETWPDDCFSHLHVEGWTPLYITPPQCTWVGLTPQERDEINEQVYGAVPHHIAFHAAIEAKLKEKNT